MPYSRRDVLKLGLAGTGVFLAPFSGTSTVRADPFSDCRLEELPLTNQPIKFSPTIERFQQPLQIPATLKPSLSKTYPVTRRGITYNQDIDYYDITMQQQVLEVMPARDGKPPITAKFWTYNGTVPGPLICQEKNRESCVRFTNHLGLDAVNKPICTSVHLHGMASLPQYDGYAEDLIPPGHYKDYYYPNNRASILWYHDHAVHKTSRNVYMGLAGMYIVKYDPEDFCDPSQADRLPSGEFEIPLIIQDKAFEIPAGGNSNEWRLVFNDRRQQGVYADMLMVNGVPSPYLKVQRRKYFFRVLNASASRTYQLTLSRNETGQIANDDNYRMTVVGSDAGLLAEPVDLVAPQSLRLGVAERYGLVIDFANFPADTKHVYLRHQPYLNNLGQEPPVIMRFDLEGAPIPTPPLPRPLGIMTDRQALIDRAVRTRTFRFGRGGDWTINGKTWSRDRVDGNPEQCDIEIWNLTNTGGWTHPVHIHLIDFRVIDRNGLPPKPYEQGWKDVVVLNSFETVRVVAKFAPHRGKYMMHCHNIVHEDHDMMTQFEVGKNGPDPLSDRAKPLPAPQLGSTTPPPLLEDLPCKCFEPLPNNCNIQVPAPPDCQTNPS